MVVRCRPRFLIIIVISISDGPNGSPPQVNGLNSVRRGRATSPVLPPVRRTSEDVEDWGGPPFTGLRDAARLADSPISGQSCGLTNSPPAPCELKPQTDSSIPQCIMEGCQRVAGAWSVATPPVSREKKSPTLKGWQNLLHSPMAPVTTQNCGINPQHFPASSRRRVLCYL